MILFGSHARGEARKDSDLDFLVIEPHVANRREESVRLRRELRGLGIAADVVVSADHVAEWGDVKSTMLHDALSESRILEGQYSRGSPLTLASRQPPAPPSPRGPMNLLSLRYHARSRLAERHVDEGTRMDEHPGIVFRSGPTGRRAALAGGPDVWEVMQTVNRGKARGNAAVTATADLLDLTELEIRIAVRYYAAYPNEIDERIRRNVEVVGGPSVRCGGEAWR